MNHQTGKAKVDLPFRGFRLSQGSQALEVGHRPDAWLSCAAKPGAWANLRVRRLWENFPIGLRTTPAGLAADFLAASEDGEATELQGGEAKSYSFDLSFADQPQSLAALVAPATLRVFPKSIASAKVLPYLYRKELPAPWSGWLEGIVAGDRSFFAKREQADEYGWRHFGDLFADHEAIHTPAESPLASHYNNQYDPLLSLLRQFWVRGDRRWFELADDLARHLRDIDIYNTEEDREEYNGGMFWHTDHYLDAGTCSHRSYSAAHAEIKGSAGGGPSLEHCYSQGLAHHYFISGNRDSKMAVLQLANWVIRVNRGPSTLLGSLYKLRRQKGPLKAWLRRRKPQHYRCPFNRASGNSLHTLLDAFLVTEDRKYLDHAHWLIRNCAGPGDDPNARDLLNAEANWSYTVFLDALARYLGVLEELGEDSDEHAYGASTLALYTNWMIDHEINYLDRRDELEFPNETWPAQDLRKARVILRACRYLSQDRVETGRAKAIHLFDRAIEHLQEFPDEKRALTRPMILLLQNYEAVVSLRDAEISSTAVPAVTPTPAPTFGDYLREQFAYALRRTSIGKELRWVRTRILHARA